MVCRSTLLVGLKFKTEVILIPGYPDVRIENSTPWRVEYNIRYRSFFCGDDKGQELEADEVGTHPRGACLITS